MDAGVSISLDIGGLDRALLDLRGATNFDPAVLMEEVRCARREPDAAPHRRREDRA